MESVGFIGLGTMGGPMARNVLKGGSALTVLDISEEAVTRLTEAGASAAATPRDVAAAANVVITMLPDAPDVERAALGEDGVRAGLGPGSVFIDMSTIDPGTTRKIGAELAASGISMIDCPVGKTVDHAIAGTLTLMAGGERAVIDRVRPILECMGSDVIHCGDLGMGQAMKLTNNLLASALMAANAEALVAGTRAGLSLDTMLSVLRTTLAWNRQLEVAMHDRALRGDFAPGFMVRLAHKDCRLALKMNQDLGLKAPVGEATLAALAEAMDNGLGSNDVGALLKLREDAAGVRIRLTR